MGEAGGSARPGDREERETQAAAPVPGGSNPYDGPVQLEGNGGAPGTVLGVQVEGEVGGRVSFYFWKLVPKKVDPQSTVFKKLKCLVRTGGRA